MRFQDLLAYRKSFDLAMTIFQLSKSFPKEETYSLTDQIRRSSRSISANISEAYRKRLYPKHFIRSTTSVQAHEAFIGITLKIRGKPQSVQISIIE